MLKLSRVVVAAAAAISLQAHAGIVIDAFTVAQSAAVSVTPGAGVWTASTAGNASIIGGQRDIYAVKDGGPLGSDVGSTVAGDGFFRFSQGSDARGTGILRWDGANILPAIDKTGLNGADLSAGNVFLFKFKSDASNPLTPFFVSIDAWDMTGLAATVSFETENTFGTLADGFVAYNEFTTPVGFDWGNIGALEVRFNTALRSAIDVDITLGQVTVPVPEPTSLALTGLALLGLGAVRRLKKA